MNKIIYLLTVITTKIEDSMTLNEIMRLTTLTHRAFQGKEMLVILLTIDCYRAWACQM